MSIETFNLYVNSTDYPKKAKNELIRLFKKFMKAKKENEFNELLACIKGNDFTPEDRIAFFILMQLSLNERTN